jgi:hypothetical protein
MRRFPFIRLLLVFALLFAQTGGIAHGIAHTLAEQSQDQSLPHDRLCDLCAAYAQIGGAIGSSAIKFAAGENCETLYTADSAFYLSGTFTAFAARAPPYSA